MIARKSILTEIAGHLPVQTVDNELKGKPVSEYYGVNSFNDVAMKKYIPYKAYEQIKTIVREGGKIDSQLAESVAHGMKEWAISRGATHFTHWFHPMTGLTAEKHDSFLSFTDSGLAIERFSGKNLIQGEPDASSFPSGGLRSTFEARGYTLWDPTSPAFLSVGVNGTTLVIPTTFISYTGEALDKKTPLLRSMDRLNDAAVRMLKIFGNKTVTRVHSTVGPEQEYFLIDKSYYMQRPDLILAGRTLFGAKPPKGQELEDHYFGSIRDRILAFMHDVEVELFKLGIPVKTRHNEVAPAQFEIAPIFEDSNLATDHNQLVMETLRKVSARHGLAVLLHEKPFAGVNGSGKHNNFSMSDSNNNNLLEPGKTPQENLQFLTFLMAIVKAVYKYSDLLRATIASAGNDHRLGANEAPPAIISVFLGEQLNSILDNIENSKKTDYNDQAIIDLGINKVPVISKDATDRNRTSPFAFTGNKFEFRAVGSAQSIATANVVLNSIVTDLVNEFSDSIEANMKKGMDLNKAAMEVIVLAIKESKAIRFEGNNYSAGWEKEAAKRGLPNKKTSPEALKDFISEKNKNVLTKYKVLTEAEIESRYTIELEHYIKSRNIEAECTLDIAKTMILPACIKYEGDLASTVVALANAKGSSKAVKTQTDMLNKYAEGVADLDTAVNNLDAILEKRDSIHDESKKAEFYCNEVLPAMDAVRTLADMLEEITDDEIWPLPKYREMLFNY